MEAVNLAAKFGAITEHWSPRIVATVNDYEVRIARVHGEFVRHSHPDSDEFFLVVDGELTIRMDGGDVVLRPGEVFVVPRGVPHQPYAAVETSILMFEPREVVNTGDAGGSRTVVPQRI
jgi:mannose-6-phosphate isomerase-like protein (cupin superfamily)